MDNIITVDEDAADFLKSVIANEEGAPNALRLAVTGSGCSGFSFGLYVEDAIRAEDDVEEHHGLVFVLAKNLRHYLEGSVISCADDGMGGIKIDNPNVTGGGCGNCSCGSS